MRVGTYAFLPFAPERYEVVVKTTDRISWETMERKPDFSVKAAEHQNSVAVNPTKP